MHVNEHQGFLCFCCLFPPLLRWGYFIRLNWNWVRKWVKCVRGRIDITCFSIPVRNLTYCGLYKWCSVFLNRSVVVYETSHANHLIFIPIPPFHSTNDLKNIVCKQRKTKTVQPFKCNKKSLWNSLVSSYTNSCSLMGIFFERKYKNAYRAKYKITWIACKAIQNKWSFPLSLWRKEQQWRSRRQV